MRNESLKFLEKLVNTPSPSGHEIQGQKVWLEYVKPFADKIKTDAYGNAVAVRNPGGSPRIMLAAHADEIALCVSYINDEGFLYVRRLGGVDPAITKAQRVTIHSARGPVNGVVGNVAPHLTKHDKEKEKKPQISDLFIDIGVASRGQAEALVQIGDPVTLTDRFELLRNDLAVARAFDNRVGTFAVAEALRLLAEGPERVQAEVCVVSNIMEEVGCLGARQIAYNLHPDVALVVDVTHATDYPTVEKTAHGDVRLGKGPTLTYGGANHREVVARLEEVARNNEIPWQREAVSSTSGTDTDVIFWTRGGIPCALISLPNRYMHSPVEVVNLNDLDSIPKLMAEFCRSVQSEESFKIHLD